MGELNNLELGLIILFVVVFVGVVVNKVKSSGNSDGTTPPKNGGKIPLSQMESKLNGMTKTEISEYATSLGFNVPTSLTKQQMVRRFLMMYQEMP